MIAFGSAELATLVASLLWPLTRILGFIAAAPVFGHTTVPARVKLGLGLLVTMVVAPTVPAAPAADPVSLAGLLIVAQQLVIGVAMGFAMRIAFAALEMAGEIAGLSMGLGFAAFYDPGSHGNAMVLSRLLTLVVTLAFLALDGHLLMLGTLAESFRTLPVSAEPLRTPGLRTLVEWGATVFTLGLQLALPVVATLLVTNVALGILARAAPQLNMFGVGFPVTLGVGLLVLALSMGLLLAPIERLFDDALRIVQAVVAGITPAPR